MYLYAISTPSPHAPIGFPIASTGESCSGRARSRIAAAACGGSTGGGGNAPSVASSSLTKKKIESTLNFYNWAQYHDPKNAKAFSQKYGVAFKESNYASNEELLTKLQTTKGQAVYDIIVPDADHVRIEKEPRPADEARPQPASPT